MSSKYKKGLTERKTSWDRSALYPVNSAAIEMFLTALTGLLPTCVIGFPGGSLLESACNLFHRQLLQDIAFRTQVAVLLLVTILQSPLQVFKLADKVEMY
jgi:hypothetical protein